MAESKDMNENNKMSEDNHQLNAGLNSDLNSDKFELFELQLSKLLFAKQELFSYMKSENEMIVRKYELIVDQLKKDMNLLEKNLRQQLNDLTNEKIAIDEKATQDRTQFALKLKETEEELFELKSSNDKCVKDFELIVREKDKTINSLQNEKNKSENSLKVEINKLEKRLQDLNNQLFELKKSRDLDIDEINSLKTKLNSFETENNSFKATILLVNEKNNNLEIKCESLLNERERLKQTLDFETKAKHEKMETIQSLTDSLNENHNEIESLKENWIQMEKSKVEEINSLKSEMNLKEKALKEQINQLVHEKNVSDKKSINDINSLIKKLQETEEELQKTKTNAEKDKNHFESLLKEKDKAFQDLKSDKNKAESQLRHEISNLTKQSEEDHSYLSDMTSKYEKAMSHLTQIKGQLMTSENEKEVLKSSLLNANEKYYSFELKNNSLNNEVEKYKHLLETESKDKREKMQIIESLNNTIHDNQLEMERLVKSVKDLDNNYRESEDARTSVMQDCNELRTTLMEVEKSRLELRRDLNNSRINCGSLENKIKTKENEFQEMVRRLETLKEERNSLKDSLESSSKSLSQIKDINMQLSQRNKQLQTAMSFSENEKREAERQLNSTSIAVTDKDNSLLILKKENESLRDRLNKVENERKRLERSYSLIEREKSSLRITLDDIQRKTNKTFQTSSNNDVIIDEAKIITQGLAALEQKNLELQRKVQGLQSLMNEAENINSSDMGTQLNGDIPQHSNNDLEKLRLAQKQAESLIDRKDFSSKHLSELEKELTRLSLSPSFTSTPSRFKEPPMRSSSTSKISSGQTSNYKNTETSTPLPLHSSASGLHHSKRRLTYNKS